MPGVVHSITDFTAALEDLPRLPSPPDVSPPQEGSQNEQAVTIRRASAYRGYGVFALQDLPQGHNVIVESPTFSCLKWQHGNGVYGNVNHADKAWVKLPMEHQEELKNRFRRLKSVAMGAQIGTSDKKRVKDFINEYAFWANDRSNAHIYKLACFINHACDQNSCSNAQYRIDGETHCINVRLTAPVKAGEEIFIDYGKDDVQFQCAKCGTRLPLTRFLGWADRVFP